MTSIQAQEAVTASLRLNQFTEEASKKKGIYREAVNADIGLLSHALEGEMTMQDRARSIKTIHNLECHGRRYTFKADEMVTV